MAEIKLYGTLVNMTSDQKVAYTRQLYDELINKFQEAINEDIYNKLKTSNTSIEDINTILSNLIVDNLDSDDGTKGLSAKQGKVLKSLVEAIHSFSIIVLNEGEELPIVGESNTLYFKKKTGSSNDVYDEYIYVNSDWELIGTTQIDLSNYYTKSEVDDIKDQIESKIPTVPNIEVSIAGQGNIVTSVDVDINNKHKLIVNKELDVYSKQQVDEKLSDAGLGDVTAAEAFTTADRVITSNGVGKVVKDSGILIGNLALKSDLTWTSIQDKPSTFPPSAHKHVLTDITDAGALAGKDKVDESDLNFNIPEGVVVDSTLSTTSENPVQNKVITAELNNKIDDSDLNITLADYYTKTETYNKSEVDEKIGSAGGGDVMASGDLVENNIVLGAGTKSIKDSGIALTSIVRSDSTLTEDNIVLGGINNTIKSGLLKTINGVSLISTGSMPTNNFDISKLIQQDIITGSPGEPIQDLYNYPFKNAGEFVAIKYDSKFTGVPVEGEQFVGFIQAYEYTASNNWKARAFLTSETTGKIYTAAFSMGQVESINWVEIGNNNSSYELPKATDTVLGGIKTGYSPSQTSIAVKLAPGGDAYAVVTSNSVTSALGFTPANANDIPEIPIALPNPYSLSITAGGSTNVYTGSTAVGINLDSIFGRKLKKTTTPGNPGIYFTTQTTLVDIYPNVTEAEPDAIVVVPAATPVTINEPVTYNMDGIDSLFSATSGTYKCFCISWIAAGATAGSEDLILVNGAIYG